MRWRTLVVLLTPPLTSVVLLFSGTGCGELPPLAARTLWLAATMAVYWSTEALPLPATSLLPLLALPVLGVAPTAQISAQYFKDANALYVGGLMVAMAVEGSGLHRRIALRVLLAVGVSPPRLLAGFMLSTAGLSAFLSNTATAAMMLPIARQVLEEVEVDAAADAARRRASADADHGRGEDDDDDEEGTVLLEMGGGQRVASAYEAANCTSALKEYGKGLRLGVAYIDLRCSSLSSWHCCRCSC